MNPGAVPGNLRLAASAARVQGTRRDLLPCQARFSPPFVGSHARPSDQLGWGEEATGASSAAVGTIDSTLGILIERLWEGLWSAGGTPCPVCRGTMRLRDGAGCCERCGSVLS
jgi:hypothetical protein